MAEASTVQSSSQSILHTPLGKRDISDIINALAPVASDWELLGTCLSVDTSVIKEIEKLKFSPKRALFELITRWLETTDRTVTWIDIVKALRMPILDQKSLAKEIEDKANSKTLRKSISTPSQTDEDSTSSEYMRSESSPAFIQASTPTSPIGELTQSLAPLDSAAMTQSTTPTQERSSPASTATSKTPIQEVVSSQSSKTETSVQTEPLDQLLSTASQTVDKSSISGSKTGEDEADSAMLPYSCGCGECSVLDFFVDGCPNPLKTVSKFRYLDTSGLTDDDRETLEAQLNEDYLDINRKYASLTFSLRKSLRKQKISPKMVVDCLMDLQGYKSLKNSTDDKDVALLKDRYDEMARAKDITDVFKILSDDYCSFFNYDIIEYITENLGTEEDNKKLAEYKVSLDKYSEHHVFECPCYSGKSSKFPDLVLKLDETEVVGSNLKALRNFTTKTARRLRVTKHTLKVCDIKKGCLEVTFQIPRHINDVIFPLSEDQKESLRLEGVMRIECDGVEYLSVATTQIVPSVEPKPLASADEQGQKQTRVPFEPRSQPGHFDLPQIQRYAAAVRGIASQPHGPPRSHGKSKSRMCLKYKLLKKCPFGDNCRYAHTEFALSFEPVFDYIPVPSSTSSSSLRSFLNKVDQAPSSKGFIAVESDRAHGSPEIKIIAEDVSTLKYAKENIQKKFSLPPGEKVQRTRECVKYKLLGKCEYDPCIYVHGDKVESPSIGYVPHPVGKIPNIKKAIGHAGYSKGGGGYYVTALSDRDRTREVKVIAENDKVLYNAKKEVAIYFGQSHSLYRSTAAVSLALCYVHPEGLTSRYQLQMQRSADMGKHEYTLAYAFEEGTMSTEVETLTVKEFQHLDKELQHSVGYMLDHPEETLEMEVLKYPHQVRLLSGYRERIHKLLRDTLQWMHHGQLYPKLEGRFGVLCWTNVPPFLTKGPLNKKGFINFISTNEKHKRYFRTRLGEADTSRAVKKMTDLDSCVESYDLKISVQNKGKVDIRLKFIHGKPLIIAVRKDEEKILISDILCLHRKHDMRLSLSSYGVIPHDDPTVEKFVKTVALLEPGKLTFTPQAQDKEWITRIVRHKKRRAYLYGKNYIVTVSEVNSYDIKPTDLDQLKETSLTLEGNDWKKHHEIEIQNLKWEVDFGHQLDLTPEQSLSLLIDPAKIPASILTSSPQPWTPDSIMANFEGDEFLQMMDDINSSFEVPVSA